MTDLPELKPCPICGGKPIINDTAEYRQIICYSDANYDGGLVYHCCEVENSDYDKAVEIWNRRAEPIGNSEELPLWMREVIEMRKQHLIPHLINPYVKNTFERGFHSALNWVLSLKKPEKKP